MTRHDYARQLRDLGLSVFPIPDGTKVPTVSWKPLQDRLATDDELRDWFPDTVPMNLGIVTGAISDVIVVDADTPAAVAYLYAHLPRTPWWTWTARGCHFYFAHPGGRVSNRATDVPTTAGPLPIHLRADGGYVLGHDSRHPSGAVYRSSVCAPRPALPRYWPGWLPKEERPRRPLVVPAPPRDTNRTPDRLLTRARCYLAVIPPPEIGQGSDTQTFKVACRLVRGLGLPHHLAEDLLWAWAGDRPGWTREWIAAKVANAAYGKEEIGGLLR